MTTEYAARHARPQLEGRHAAPPPSFPPAPAPPAAATTRRIEAKLDWLHTYLTRQIAPAWPSMPPWPGEDM